MSNQKLPERTELNKVPDDNDLIHLVDTKDTTDDPTGTSKKFRLFYWLKQLFVKKPTEAEENSIAVFDDNKNIKVSKAKIEEDGSILLPNGQSIKFKDYAGIGFLNVLKGNQDNSVDVGTQLNVGSIEAEEDSGAISLFDMAVSSASADGTEMSATIKIDGNNILKIYAESNGAGGADTFKVQLLNKAVLTMQDSAGTTHTYTADTDGSLIIS